MRRRPREDFEDERLLAGDAMNLSDLGQTRDRRVKGFVVNVGGRVRANECDEFEAELARVDPGGVAPNVPARLEPLDALVNRRRPQADEDPEFRKRRAPVRLQRVEEAEIGFVEVGFERIYVLVTI